MGEIKFREIEKMAQKDRVLCIDDKLLCFLLIK